MNRRSVLRFLGFAPVAAPAAVAAASEPALPPIDYSDLAADIGGRIDLATFSFNRASGVLTMQASSLSVTTERFEAAINSETEAQVEADCAGAARIDGVISRID